MATFLLPKHHPLPFIHPSTIVVNGPTGCGKTMFVKRVIESEIIQPAPERIIWFYGEPQLLHQKIMEGIQLVEGLPSNFKEYIHRGKRHLFIIDDLMKEAANSSQFSDLFTKVSHHQSVTVIWITQNLYHQGKYSKEISVNTQYLVLFGSLNDKTQINLLNRRIFPENPKFLVRAYEDATKEQYGYLVLDLRPETQPIFRVRTKLFEFNTIFKKK